ncbi:Sugar transporter STL1 [Lasiodiplodia theobromae]|uniref:Sugar transporter STL1 n=1 Tax=Lasiodiplodia theobromae TaxID=45133 RepID=A0A5N5D971_9PEZI|nr:Sugar transporter STL1 [Lasiodiplodia theobromae]
MNPTRVVTGIGNGMNTSSIPVWQSEMAPPKTRGFLVLFEGALITGGIMVSYCYYATTVFETSLSFSPELSRLMSGFLGTEYFLAAVLALFIVDRLGRRRLMMWGALGMALCLLIIGICLSQTTPSYRAPAYAATVFIFVYNTCFAVGWLGVTWL